MDDLTCFTGITEAIILTEEMPETENRFIRE
jgi:hypothetical protein